jgi:hypothetical protein
LPPAAGLLRPDSFLWIEDGNKRSYFKILRELFAFSSVFLMSLLRNFARATKAGALSKEVRDLKPEQSRLSSILRWRGLSSLDTPSDMQRNPGNTDDDPVRRAAMGPTTAA